MSKTTDKNKFNLVENLIKKAREEHELKQDVDVFFEKQDLDIPFTENKLYAHIGIDPEPVKKPAEDRSRSNLIKQLIDRFKVNPNESASTTIQLVNDLFFSSGNLMVSTVRGAGDKQTELDHEKVQFFKQLSNAGTKWLITTANVLHNHPKHLIIGLCDTSYTGSYKSYDPPAINVSHALKGVGSMSFTINKVDVWLKLKVEAESPWPDSKSLTIKCNNSESNTLNIEISQ